LLKPPRNALDTHNVPEDPPSLRPWQVASALRFAALLACLWVAVLALLLTRTGLGRALGVGGGGEAARAAPAWCTPGRLPPLARVDFKQLLALRAELPRVIAPIGGHRYEGGVASAERMWSDNSPQPLDAVRPVEGRWPAAYEMRWWTAGNADVAADVLAFPSDKQATRFFAKATSVHCHRDGQQPPSALPPRVRNLVWVNPDRVTEYDAYLRRGRLVYRVVDVPPRPHAGRSPAQPLTTVYAVDLLACALPEAGCAQAPGRSERRLHL
jgi:hypothetical protein